jgi:hypothetical protein
MVRIKRKNSITAESSTKSAEIKKGFIRKRTLRSTRDSQEEDRIRLISSADTKKRPPNNICA